MSNTYGYIRVSTKEQNEDRQIRALTEFGIEIKNIIMDKQSGKDFDRPGYKKLLGKIKEGDTVVIKSIDRLGRNYDEILTQWRMIMKKKQADIVVLDMPLLDTRNGKDLTGTLISDIVLQLLSYVAQTERELIRSRQAEGIAAAKARGVKFGRKPIHHDDKYNELKMLYLSGKVSARKASKELNISHTSFINWVKSDKEKEKAI